MQPTCCLCCNPCLYSTEQLGRVLVPETTPSSVYVGEVPLRPVGWGHMIMQKPDVVGLLGGSLLEVSLGCLPDLKEAGQSLPVGVAMGRAEAACSDSSFCRPL